VNRLEPHALPETLSLTVRKQAGLLEISFDKPERSFSKLAVVVAFIIVNGLVWLFAIAVFVTMAVALVQGSQADTAGQVIGIGFITLWIAGWGYGGMVLLRSLYRMFKARQRLTLHPDHAVYRSGRPEDEPPPWRFWTGGIRIARHTVGSVRLENNTIVLTAGAQRIRIGQNLDTQSARWLFAQLQRWLM